MKNTIKILVLVAVVGVVVAGTAFGMSRVDFHVYPFEAKEISEPTLLFFLGVGLIVITNLCGKSIKRKEDNY